MSKEFTKDRDSKKGNSNNRGKGRNYNNKGKRGGSGRKPDNASTSDDNKHDKSFVYEDRDNPVEYYTGSPQHAALVKSAAATVNFNVVGGLPYDVSGIAGNLTPPGLMAFRMVTGPGISNANEASAVTLATRSMWSEMRQKLTNASRYQPADVAMAIMAMDEVYSLAAHIHRMFKCVNTYYAQNVQFPVTFLIGLYDFDSKDVADLMNKRAAYMSKYNNMCLQMLKLTIPAEYGFVDRHRYLYQDIFSDGHTVKSQYYGFKPYGYRYWSDVRSDQGSSLKFVTMYSDKSEATTKPSYLLSVLQYMINQLTGSESFLEILGDIWKVFGSNSAYAASPVAEFDVLNPVFDAFHVMSQIENSINVPISAQDIKNGAYDITQDVESNSIIFNPSFSTLSDDDKRQISLLINRDTLLYGKPGAWINMHSPEPTPEDVIEATRMLPTFEWDREGNSATVASMGYDFIDSFEIFGFEYNNEYKSKLLFAYNYVTAETTDALQKVALLSMFDWAPRFFVYTTDGNYPVADIDNYAR